MAAKKSGKPPVQAVDENYVPPRKDPMSVSEAAESGSRIDELVAMRAIIARAIDNDKTLARDLAALSRRQIEISREIELLRVQEAEAERESSGHVEDEKWRPEAI